MIRVFGKEVPTELHELVDLRSTVLLIIDMQNDSCSPGGTCHKAGGDLSMYDVIIPRIANFAEVCRRYGVPVIHIQLERLPEGKSDSISWLRLRMRSAKAMNADNLDVWRVVIQGTWGAEFVDVLKPKPGDLIVKKFRSSAFRETNLDLLLRSNRIQSLLLAGSTTEGCVESTARDAGFYDYLPIVLEDCVGSDVRKLHDASMLVMSAYRADIANSTQIAEIWLHSNARTQSGPAKQTALAKTRG